MDNYLNIIIQECRKIDFGPQMIEIIPQEEIHYFINSFRNKFVKQGGVTASFSNGFSLGSNNYNECTPVIIQDHLNGYAMHFHIDANDNAEDLLSQKQSEYLKLLPKGILEVTILKTPSTRHNLRDIAPELTHHRNDLFSIREHEFSFRETYDVRYIPENRVILVKPKEQKDLFLIYTLPNIEFDFKEQLAMKYKLSPENEMHYNINF